ncbi:DNA repair protein RecN [Rhodobacter sphaeroides]|uniref:DNA repair protein RecN n=1 Tax=Cereibacter sphaeroides (strain ATCC 17023 / DSM 158 / JCM 6121 / CCUG 31486 / LMG 2827 / NBRC 12203 / NCIMB 8253 / ATH 2.4.1.) TaxID=272943 RepID=Q3J4L2_CERS4|nr:DNA repair protein RecN [Cereibacter sphaeroides]ABA78272.1 DNA replication and repair protein RecN [Cereibacter sphaeroides 2.4.1]AMJ46631.1 DNA repair protein RecN [Cereibacter sphaeroides]ANS33344.1 DNA repair protein RecN [Cereibacter sphaeroides]ATN62387.1 DNA repair protein RecN [Cereibacter sphaeroides]AXC60494.1 DNA repair protein RecN [Cereibacter sphaeroides 2.4.1]
MLRSLDIRDMLIIDRLSLAFQPGLNVLTGETGAGKSILLDSLGFVLGWRGRAELVRAGADKGEVTAVFDLPPGHAARAVLDEAGIEAEDELILRRVNFADGRKTAWVNDRRVSGEVLRGLSDRLVELHGQHDDRGLLNPRGHRQMLDTFAGLDLSACRRAWTALGTARRTLLAAEEALAAVRAEEDFLRHAVAELDKLDPQPGEEALLDTRRREMQGAEKIRDDIARAHRALSAEGAETLLVDALRWLETASDRAGNRLEAPLAALSRALLELGEAQDGVEACLADLDFDPRDLEALEERLFAIRALARKHSVLPDELGTFAEELRGRLAALDGGTKQIDALRRALAEAEAAWEAEAAILSEARRGAAGRLDAAMAAELAPLKMERAVFETQVTEADPGPEGRDAVAFTVATNPGAPAGPLNRIASGGELSRFLLALKVCLTGDSPGLTLIFDEIDRGVGGATADAVGRRLKALAEGAQVLVVTHSPQVAALGAHHWRVEKRVAHGMTTSTVSPLGAGDRIEEIARMLAGDTITDAAREAARALLD